MFVFLCGLLGGWKELRTSQGYSYQVSRSGKRRVVPVADYGRRGLIDEGWLKTGERDDVAVGKRFGNYSLPVRRGVRPQLRSA
jgi:hypothetical protein